MSCGDALSFRDLWAKTDRDDPAKWHPLANHLVEVAAVALEMWESVLAPASKKRWTDFCGGDADAAGRWLAFLAGVHDLGKCSPIFEAASKEQRARLERAGVRFPRHLRDRLPHGVITAGTLPALLQGQWPVFKSSGKVTRRYGAVSGMHHGWVFDSTTIGVGSTKVSPRAVGEGEWDDWRRDLFEYVLECVGDIADVPERQVPYSLATWLAGVISVADWIGSNTDYFPFDDRVREPSEAFECARVRAKKALDGLGLHHGALSIPPEFEKQFPAFEYGPNTTQRATIEAVSAMTGPGAVIVEAQMGDGKTEAAFWTAAHAQHFWGTRGAYWEHHAAITPPQTHRRGKSTARESLVLTGHGVQFRIEQGTLVICNGFTHYPQHRQEWRFFPGDRTLPSRIIVLDADGSISLHVVAWLTRHGIPLVLLDWQGQVISVLNGDGKAPDATLRQAQRDAQKDSRGLDLATQLIRAKLDASLDTLRTLPKSPVREQSIARVQRSWHDLEVPPLPSIEALRLVEGRAALAYFSCWQTIPLRWKGTGRGPIPEDWHHAGLRQSFVSGTNRHATHPVNAMLNYAYGVLESQVRIAAVEAGLDPTIGYLHACRPGRVALVYDLMEPLRPQVDRWVLDFVQERTFDPRDFIMTERGVCRLHPQLARTVTGLALGNSVVQEVVTTIAGAW